MTEPRVTYIRVPVTAGCVAEWRRILDRLGKPTRHYHTAGDRLFAAARAQLRRVDDVSRRRRERRRGS